MVVTAVLQIFVFCFVFFSQRMFSVRVGVTSLTLDEQVLAALTCDEASTLLNRHFRCSDNNYWSKISLTSHWRKEKKNLHCLHNMVLCFILEKHIVFLPIETFTSCNLLIGTFWLQVFSHQLLRWQVAKTLSNSERTAPMTTCCMFSKAFTAGSTGAFTPVSLNTSVSCDSVVTTTGRI